MTLVEAAVKWKLSPNWVRELVKSGRVKATLRKDVPVPYYEIPDDTPKPESMARSPYRKNSNAVVTKEAIRRRETRASERKRTSVSNGKKAIKSATSKLMADLDAIVDGANKAKE